MEPAVLDWGSAKCLEPITKHVKITNNSVIDAHIKSFMKTKSSLWTISPKASHLKPHESIQVALTLTIDEVMKTSDVMHVVVQDSNDIQVTVKAKGVDTPVTCSEPLDVIDIGTQYTTQTITHEFVMENKGKKQRKLVWTHESMLGSKRPEEHTHMNTCEKQLRNMR